jgi:hypothetical protein
MAANPKLAALVLVAALAGSVQCDSGQAALRCIEQKSQHGFTLAVADYGLF